MGTSSETPTALCVARQAILDRAGRVFGYELLYRRAPGDTACLIQRDLASASVITSAVFDLGLDTLTNGRHAFLNVTSRLLVDEIDELIPPAAAVLEILETIDVTPKVIDACRRLKEKGYQLALDDFVPGSAAEALLPYASFVKVDVLATPVESAAALAARLKPTGVIMLAEKVETRDVYEQMGKAGFTLFQGYDFCKPVIKTGTAIPAQQLVYVRLLAALSNPQLGILELEALVKQDVSLSLRVLKFVNSAAVPVRTEVGTIRQALVLIGMNPIRKWAAVWCLAGLNAGATPELATLALVRARLCELLSEYSQDLDSSELFLVGLCSLLDVMLSRSMADALESLPLSAVTTEALLGTQNKERAVLDAAIAFESGAWEDAAAAARRGGLDPDLLPSAYTSAVQWAQEVARGGITAPPAP